jgi:steroid 5-alpha reductase family enzyme
MTMDPGALLAWAESWPLAAGLTVALAAFTLVWLLHLPLRDASIVDVLWGPAFLLLAAVYAALPGAPVGARGLLVLVLVGLWSLRLGGYLFHRRRGEPEDARYGAMRERRGAAFPWVSLPLVFWLQAAICWVVSWPLYQGIRGRAGGATGLGWLDLAGTALFAVGFLFETIGDFQLARFKADPQTRGRVMDRGLWHYTRHPNYFGECVLWWGLGLIALATGWSAWWTLAGPVLMTVLLLGVSGVTLLESHLRETRPGYAEYVRRTNAFVPGRPKE